MTEPAARPKTNADGPPMSRCLVGFIMLDDELDDQEPLSALETLYAVSVAHCSAEQKAMIPEARRKVIDAMMDGEEDVAEIVEEVYNAPRGHEVQYGLAKISEIANDDPMRGGMRGTCDQKKELGRFIAILKDGKAEIVEFDEPYSRCRFTVVWDQRVEWEKRLEYKSPAEWWNTDQENGDHEAEETQFWAPRGYEMLCAVGLHEQFGDRDSYLLERMGADGKWTIEIGHQVDHIIK